MSDQPMINSEAYKQFERDGYSRVAEKYDSAIAQVTSQANEVILDAVKTTHGIKLLDVACGPGWLSFAAVQRQAIVTGLDFVEKMLTIARLRCPEAEFHQGDAENLSFAENQFDAVVCSLGFPHFLNPEQVIAEAFRVLKPEGRYAFTCWTPPARNPFMNLILGTVQTHGTMDLDLPPGPPLFRFGEPAECERTLSARGFVSISTTEVPIIWSFSAPEEVIKTVVTSSARLGPLLTMQTEEQRRNIEEAIIEKAKTYATNRGIEIPASVILSAARKPSGKIS